MTQIRDTYLPYEAEVVEMIHDSDEIFTLRLRLTDPIARVQYRFQPGQFNMVYLYGVGDVAISIVNDRDFKAGQFEHTIHRIGHVTTGLQQLKAGDRIGIRGPYGTHWPLAQAKGKDVVVMTGGLGNAPLVAAVESMLNNREYYGKLTVVQGLRDTAGLIYQDKYIRWLKAGIDVRMAATAGEPFGPWQWYQGFVTAAIPEMDLDPANTVVMSVGPEIMMLNVAKSFIEQGVPAQQIYVSLERNMKCAVGHCGHCQLGPEFVCKDGPVYAYDKVAHVLSVKGI